MSACQDQMIRVFDTSRGGFTLTKAIRARNVGWSVLDTALSPDNRHLIYSSWCEYSKRYQNLKKNPFYFMTFLVSSS